MNYKRLKFIVSIVLAAAIFIYELNAVFADRPLGIFINLAILLVFAVRFVISAIQNRHAKAAGKECPYPNWYDMF